MLTACNDGSGVKRSGQTAPLNVAQIPDEYLKGCEQFIPELRRNGLTRVNSALIADAFARCSKLQADETRWIVAYLNRLAGRK